MRTELNKELIEKMQKVISSAVKGFSIKDSESDNLRKTRDLLDSIQKIITEGISQVEEEERLLERRTQSGSLKSFIDKATAGWDEASRSALKLKMVNKEYADKLISNYQSVAILKCASSGKILPIDQFGIDLRYPARNFRSPSSK